MIRNNKATRQQAEPLKFRTLGLRSKLLASSFLLVLFSPSLTKVKAHAQSDIGPAPPISVTQSTTGFEAGGAAGLTGIDPGMVGSLNVTTADSLHRAATDTQSGNGPNAPAVTAQPGMVPVDVISGLIPAVPGIPSSPDVPSLVPALSQAPAATPDSPLSIAATTVAPDATSPSLAPSTVLSSPAPSLLAAPGVAAISVQSGSQTFADGFSLDLSSVAATVAAPISAPVHITVGGNLSSSGAVVGGTEISIAPGQLITPSQYVALTQVLQNGTQNILLTAGGAAEGGGLTLSAAQTGTFSSLVLPQQVTLSGIGFGSSDPFSVSGSANIAGSLFALQTTAATDAVYNFGNLNISGQLTGDISQLPTYSIQLPSGSLFSSATLSLATLGAFQNSGTVSSLGQLNITSGASFDNSGTLSGSAVSVASLGAFTNSGTVLASGGNLDVNSLSGSFNNSGMLSAIAGSANINTATAFTTANINFDNSNGSVAARDINFRSGLDGKGQLASGKVDTTIVGGDFLSDNLNIDSYGGIISADAGNISGTVNATAAVVHLVSSGADLKLGNLNVTDDPTFYNTGGSVTLGSLNLPGQSLAIAARNNVTVSGSIRTSPGVQRGDVSIVAGAHFASPTAITGGQSGPNSTTTVTVDGPSETGGKIQIGGSIDTGGGDLRLVAYTGTAIDSGRINAANSINTHGGDVTIYGESPLTAVSIGSVDTGRSVVGVTVDPQHGVQTGGDITISGGSKVLGQLSFLNGELTAVAHSLAGVYNGGNIITGSLSGNGSSVRLTSGGSITTGGIDVSGIGGFSYVTYQDPYFVTIYSYAQAGGQVNISAANDISTGYIRAYGGGGVGGGGVNVVPEFFDGKDGAAGGSVFVKSNLGSVTVNGDLNVSGGGGGGGGAFISSSSSGLLPFLFAGGNGGAGGSVSLESGVNGSMQIAGPVLAAAGGGGGFGSTFRHAGSGDTLGVGGAGGGSFGGGGGGGMSAAGSQFTSQLPSDGGAGGGFYPGGIGANQYPNWAVGGFHLGGGGGGYFGSGSPGLKSSQFFVFEKMAPGFNFGVGGGGPAGAVSQDGQQPGSGLAGTDGSIALTSARNIEITQTVAGALGPIGSGFSSSPWADVSVSAGTAGGTVVIRTGAAFISSGSSTSLLSNANYGAGAPTSRVNLSGTQFVTAGNVLGSSVDLNSRSFDQSDQLYAGTYTRGLSLNIEEGGNTFNLSAVDDLTPAEYVAVVQKINTGVQSIVLSGTGLGTGAASGGNFTIAAESLPAAGSFSGLVLPTGVTANVTAPVVTYESSALINGSLNFVGSAPQVLVTPNLTVNGSVSAPLGLTIYDSLQTGVGADSLNIGGTGTIFGSQSMVNLDGSVVVNGSYTIGGSFTAAAGGDITINRSITASKIDLLAGAMVQPGSLPGGAPASQPSNFVVSGASANGGSVFVTGSNSLTSSSGHIALVAFQGAGTSSGTVEVAGTIRAGGVSGGNVSIFGGASGGNAVKVGDISSSNVFGSISTAGNISIFTGNPVLDGTGLVTYANGARTAGANFTAPSASGGAVITGNLSARGRDGATTNSTTVTIRSGSTVSAGNIDISGVSSGFAGSSAAAGGHLDIKSVGSISVRSVLVSAFGAGNGGSILLDSAANVSLTGTIPSQGGVSASAAGTGGTIDIRSGNGAPSLGSVRYFNDANYGSGAAASGQADILGSTISNAGALAAGGLIKLNNIDSGTNVAAGLLAREGSITITEGGASYVVRSSDLVTPAEFIALVQIATTGSQSIILDGSGPGTGFASGGSFQVSAANLPAVGNFSGLFLPGGVTETVNVPAITYDNSATVNGTLNLGPATTLVTPSLTVGGAINADNGNINIQGSGPDRSLQVSGTGSITAVNGDVFFNGGLPASAGAVSLSGLGLVSAANGNGIINFNGGSGVVNAAATGFAGSVSGGGSSFTAGSSSGTLNVGNVSSTGALTLTSTTAIKLGSAVTASGSNIKLNTPSLVLSDNAKLETVGAAALTGIAVQSNAPDFALNVTLAGGSAINSTDSSQGKISFNGDNAGDIFINSAALSPFTGGLNAGSKISFGGGQIAVKVDSINGALNSQGNGVSTASFSTNSGALNVGDFKASGLLSLATGATGLNPVNILNNSAVNGGSLSLTANQVNLGDNSRLTSGSGDILLDSHGSSALAVNLGADAVIQSAGALSFNKAGAANEGAITVSATGAVDGTRVQGASITYNLGANALAVSVGSLLGPNNVVGAGGNATSISLVSKSGAITAGSDLNASSSLGNGGSVSIEGDSIDLGGFNVLANGGGASGRGGAISLRGTSGIAGGGHIAAGGSSTGSGNGGTINTSTAGTGNILVKTLQAGGGTLGGNGGSITSKSFNLSVVDIGPSGDSIFAGGANGGTVSVVTTSTNPFIAGNPIPNGTASGINVSGTAGNGGSITIAADGVTVAKDVTVTANGTGSGGIITFDMNNPASGYPQINVNGIVTSNGAGAPGPGAGTGIVGFGAGPAQNLVVNVGPGGRVIAGQNLIIGNINPLTGLADGPASGSLFVAPALFGPSLVANGTIVVPVISGGTQPQAGGAGGSALFSFNSNQNQQDVQFLGQRTPVDLTTVYDDGELSQRQDAVQNQNAILGQTEVFAEPVIGGIQLLNLPGAHPQQNMLDGKNVALSMRPDSSGFTLSSGSVLLTATKDLTIDTPLGQVLVPAGAAVFLMVSDDGVAIFDLHQNRQNALQVVSEKKSMSLNPGSLLVLTRQKTRDFDKVQGQFQLVGHRNVNQESLSDEVNAFAMDFSLPSAFSNLGPLKDLLSAEGGPEKQLADMLLKNSALLAELTGKAGAYHGGAVQ